METKQISDLYKSIISSINFDDLSFSEVEGEWFCAISIQFKAVNRFVSDFKNADPFSVVLSWNNQVYQFLNSKNPYKIGIKGNIITAVFRTPQKSNIDDVVYYAAYICSIMDLFNFILNKKDIKKFDVGIGISTSKTRFDDITDSNDSFFYTSVDMKSVILALNASQDGLERILIDDCTQYNLSDLICFGEKKYKDVGIKHSGLHFVHDDTFGYNLNLIDFTEWINKNKSGRSENPVS